MDDDGSARISIGKQLPRRGRGRFEGEVEMKNIEKTSQAAKRCSAVSGGTCGQPASGPVAHEERTAETAPGIIAVMIASRGPADD